MRDQRLGLVQLEHASGVLFTPLSERLDVGDNVRLSLFARDVALSLKPPEGISIQNVLWGNVRDISASNDAAYALVTLEIGGATLKARLTRAASEQLQLASGREVYALIKSARLEALPSN